MLLSKSKLLQLSLFTLSFFAAQAAMANVVGSVIFKTGDVLVTHLDKTTTPAEKNSALNAGDTIETRDGRVQFSLIDGGKVSLQPNTIYKINKYEFSGKEDGSEFAFTELVKGGLRTISGLIGHKNRERYQLKTAVATIGIRGTEFTVNFNDNNLLMTTNHGSVDVCGVSGSCLNAITGQTIAISGAGGAPAFSSKAAKAAAAPPPAGGKAVFTAGEQIGIAALTTAPVTPTSMPTPTPTTGNDTIVSLATMPVGVLDKNGVYKGITTFTGNNLISYADNSGTPNIVTGTIEESNADTFVKWGRASGGTYDGQAMLMTNWVTGIATSSANMSALNGSGITGTYLITNNSTAPYLVSSSGNVTTGLTDSVTGGLSLNFSTYKLAYNLNIPIAGSIITINGSNVLLGASSAKFSDNNAIVTGVAYCGCTVTGSGILFNNASVEGSLFGPNAERVGLQYGVQVTGTGLPSGGGNLYGGVVATKQ